MTITELRKQLGDINITPDNHLTRESMILCEIANVLLQEAARTTQEAVLMDLYNEITSSYLIEHTKFEGQS